MMNLKNRSEWLLPILGAVALAVAFGSLAIRSAKDQSLETAKSRQLEWVHSMRLALIAASESESSALIAKDEQTVDRCIHQANENIIRFNQAFQELRSDQPSHINSSQLHDTEETFRNFTQIQTELNSMLKRNTNRKAYELASVTGLKMLEEIDSKLIALQEGRSEQEPDTNTKLLNLNYEVRLSLLRIQALLIPHIFEASDDTMDKLEAAMNKEEEAIGRNFRALSEELNNPARTSEIQSLLDDYQKLKTDIIHLSRENSNIRSEALVKTQLRDAVLSCDSKLIELEKLITTQTPTSMIPQGRN